jgi:hypothetical protein
MGFVVVNRPKRRDVRPPATVRQSSWLSWVVLFATVFVVFFVATVLRNAQTPGTARTFGVQFLSAVILLGVASAICAYLEARRRRKHPSAGATDIYDVPGGDRNNQLPIHVSTQRPKLTARRHDLLAPTTPVERDHYGQHPERCQRPKRRCKARGAVAVASSRAVSGTVGR